MLASTLSITSRLCQTHLRRHRFCCLAWRVNARRWVYGSTLRKQRDMSLNIKEKSRSPPKMVNHSLSKRTLSTLAPISAPLRKTSVRGRYKPGVCFTTSRTSESSPSLEDLKRTIVIQDLGEEPILPFRLGAMDANRRARSSA